MLHIQSMAKGVEKTGIGARITAARERTGLNMTELANELGVSRSAVSQWESEYTEPSAENLRAIAVRTGVNYDWLATDRGTAEDMPPATAKSLPPKIIKNRNFRFYAQEWRKFMGVSKADAGAALGLDEDQYGVLEFYPINLTLAQVADLAALFGIEITQFWFPPPKGRSAPPAPAARKRSRKSA